MDGAEMGSASTDLHPLTRRTCFRAVGNHLHEFPCWLPAPRQSAAVRFGGFTRPMGMMPARSSPHCWPSCASGSPRRSHERRSLAVWLILKGSRTMGLSPGCYFIIPPPQNAQTQEVSTNSTEASALNHFTKPCCAVTLSPSAKS